jgi:hypothetical protein
MTTQPQQPQPLQDARKLALDGLELADKATEGPWWSFDDDFDTALTCGANKSLLTGITWNEGEIVEGDTQGLFYKVVDAKFAAKARQLVPDLATALLAALDRVEALESALITVQPIIKPDTDCPFCRHKSHADNKCGKCSCKSGEVGS